MQDGVVNIRGKSYQTVAFRVSNFKEKYPDHSIETELIHRDERYVVIKAIIKNEDGRIIATGHGEEDRNQGNINKTSAVENCETSAIGRALAAFGIGGTEFASANEVQNAIHQQDNIELQRKVFKEIATGLKMAQSKIQVLDFWKKNKKGAVSLPDDGRDELFKLYEARLTDFETD